MLKRLYWLLTFLLIVHTFTWAQDPHFSQFFASPLTLNPALTGKFDGNLRVAGNYRNQWPVLNNAFRTGTVSVDWNILQHRIPEHDRFGIGLMGMYDVNGNGVLKHNYVTASIAYHKSLDANGSHQLGAGFSTTYAQKRLDAGKLNFEDELTGFGFTGNTAEVVGSNGFLNLSYADVNAGLVYNGSINDHASVYLGLSGYHLNRPSVSFLNTTYLLKPRYTLHSGGNWNLNETTQVFLSGLYQIQSGASELIFGGALGFNYTDDYEDPRHVFAGMWHRWEDAVIPYVGIEFGDFRLGFSYDINVSALAAASRRRGGIEISLQYIKKNPGTFIRSLQCPKF